MTTMDYFQFRQFTVWHDKCGMKVGTDGVLIGAWTDCAGRKRILDVGCGTGLISLMMAQRCPQAEIKAIDIDDNAVLQARENVGASVFREQIEVEKADFTTFHDEPFDLIVSNPPFFEKMKAFTHEIKNERLIARHTDTLPFEALIRKSHTLLADDGVFSVIIPYSSAQDVISIAAMNGLYLRQRCDVRNSETKPFKRSMLAFGKTITATSKSTLTLRTAENEYTDEYRELTKEFYMK